MYIWTLHVTHHDREGQHIYAMLQVHAEYAIAMNRKSL